MDYRTNHTPIYKQILFEAADSNIKSVIKLNYAAIAAGKSLSKTIKGYKPFLKALVFVTRPLAYLVLLKFPINDRGLRI